jgi:gas vesicle protein
MGDKEGGSSFLAGLLIGAVAGVAIGFLYAPKPGRETRAMLKEKAVELKDKATELKDKAGDMIHRAREMGKE